MQKEKGKLNLVCMMCMQHGPGRFKECEKTYDDTGELDFMNCEAYDKLVKRLAERLKDVRDPAQEN